MEPCMCRYSLIVLQQIQTPCIGQVHLFSCNAWTMQCQLIKTAVSIFAVLSYFYIWHTKIISINLLSDFKTVKPRYINCQLLKLNILTRFKACRIKPFQEKDKVWRVQRQFCVEIPLVKQIHTYTGKDTEIEERGHKKLVNSWGGTAFWAVMKFL